MRFCMYFYHLIPQNRQTTRDSGGFAMRVVRQLDGDLGGRPQTMRWDELMLMKVAAGWCGLQFAWYKQTLKLIFLKLFLLKWICSLILPFFIKLEVTKYTSHFLTLRNIRDDDSYYNSSNSLYKKILVAHISIFYHHWMKLTSAIA